MLKDYYKILNVKETASTDEIKKAYRKLALKFHPDKNKEADAESKFKEISEAYDTLSSVDKKKEYDNKLRMQNQKNPLFDFDSFLNYDKYHKKKESQTIKKGDDLKATLNLTIDNILNGFSTKLKINRINPCNSCNGQGTHDQKFKMCVSCNGTGYIKASNMFYMGMSSINSFTKCETCNGEGKVPINPCLSCKGLGFSESYSIIDINIPKGFVDKGFILKEEGNFLKNGKRGDLHLNINYENHSVFERDLSNIYYTLKIGLLDSILGTKVKIPTLYGDVTITLQKGIQHGKILRLSNKGLPIINSNNNGDQYLKIEISIPNDITEEELKTLSQLNDIKWKIGEI